MNVTNPTQTDFGMTGNKKNVSRKKNIKLIKIEWFEIDDFGFCGADGECVGKEHSTNSGWSYIFRNFPTLKKHPFGGGGESP